MAEIIGRNASDGEPVVTGRIDDIGRLLVRVNVIGLEDPVECELDTGFNRFLLMFESDVISAGMQKTESVETAHLASGGTVNLSLAVGSVDWLGERVQVPVGYISGQFRRTQHDYPLLGNALLDDCILVVNFKARHLTIRRG